MPTTRRTARRALAATLAAAALAALAPPARAQPDPGPAAPAHRAVRWAFGLRAGLFDMVDSPDSYDAVFGEPMPRLGAELEVDAGRRWRFDLSLDAGRVEGERVLLTDPPRGTGIGETLTTIPLHLTAAWRFRPAARWDVYAGGGPSFLSWRVSSAGDSASGSDPGGSLVVGLRRQPAGARWSFGGELRWSTFPGALPDRGVNRYYGEDDPGGAALTFLAVRGF